MTAADPDDFQVRFLAEIARGRPDMDAPVHLCRACLAVLPVQRVSITICSNAGVHEFLAASDDVAEQMEWAQITLGEGPAMDVDTAAPIAVQNVTEAAGPWPLFAKEAAAAGVSLMCVLPLQMDTIRVGALSLYLPSDALFEARNVDHAIAIADLITSILISGSTTGPGVLNPLGHWWDQPQAAREINQATGMLVAQLGIGARDAYLRLRAYSYAHGRSLGDVARDVVHTGLRFETDTDSNDS